MSVEEKKVDYPHHIVEVAESCINSFTELLNKQKKDRELEREKEEKEKENIRYFTPFASENERLKPYFQCFREIENRDFEESFINKVHESLKLISETSLSNQFSIIKRYQLNNELHPVKEKFIQKLSRSGIPSGTTSYKCRDFEDDDSNVVEEYVDELNEYFDDQMEMMKDELESIYTQFMGDYLQASNFQNEKALEIAEALALKLSNIWGDHLFVAKEIDYEPNMKRVMDIYGISAMLLPDTEFNEYDNFFNHWFSKTFLPENQIREFCNSARSSVKEVVEISRDRLIHEIHKCLFPLEVYLLEFTQIIADQCRETDK